MALRACSNRPEASFQSEQEVISGVQPVVRWLLLLKLFEVSGSFQYQEASNTVHLALKQAVLDVQQEKAVVPTGSQLDMVWWYSSSLLVTFFFTIQADWTSTKRGHVQLCPLELSWTWVADILLHCSGWTPDVNTL
ncbi:TPA: hypothetical protein ACH3X3_007010 [Trebouxia sp. C0006]